MKRIGLAGAALGLFVLSGCVSSEVTYTGNAKYPSKPVGCAIDVFPSTTPDYAWEDLATIESRCHFTQGRSACVDELKAEACKLGGDNVYSLKDGKVGEYSIVIATVGRRREGADAKPLAKEGGTPASAPGLRTAESEQAKSSALQGPGSAADSCDPPCSPGYKCAEGQCIALCNPPCGEGLRCNQQRMCESTAPAPESK